MKKLSAFDKALLNLLQSNLPVCERPFAVLAKQLNSTEEDVLAHLKLLKNAGLLRRIGTFFDSDSLGYNGTLVALQVLPQYLESVAKTVNIYPGTTHNYEREGKYNLWFTLITPNINKEREILSNIRNLDGVVDMLNLKANKKYKVNVRFSL